MSVPYFGLKIFEANFFGSDFNFFAYLGIGQLKIRHF
jgi:hypothetical protein